MIYDNAYNRNIAHQLRNIDQAYVNHSKIYGSAILGGNAVIGAGVNRFDDYPTGGNGFAASTQNDSGEGIRTLGATPKRGGKRAVKGGKMMKGGVLPINTDHQTLMGGNFWDDLQSGISNITSQVAPIVSGVASAAEKLGPLLPLLAAGKKKGGMLKSQMKSSSMSGQGRGISPWQALVKKVIMQKKLKMVDAIRYIKKHNLYKKKK